MALQARARETTTVAPATGWPPPSSITRPENETAPSGLGAASPVVAGSLDALADVERHRLHLREAELLLRRALRVYEQGDDADYSAMARDLELLTGIPVDQGHYVDAEESVKRLRRILKDYCPQDIDGMSGALELHAKLLRKSDRIAEAEKVEEDTRTLHEKHGKPGDNVARPGH